MITQWQNNILDALRQMDEVHYGFAYKYLDETNAWNLTQNIDFWLLLKEITE